MALDYLLFVSRTNVQIAKALVDEKGTVGRGNRDQYKAIRQIMMKILDCAMLGHILFLSRIQDYTAIGHPISRALLFVMISQPSQQKLLFRATIIGSEFAAWRICDTLNGSLVEFVLLRQAGKDIIRDAIVKLCSAITNLNIEDSRTVDLLKERGDVQNLCSCIPRSTRHLYVCKITSSQHCSFRDSNNCRDSRTQH